MSLLAQTHQYMLDLTCVQVSVLVGSLADRWGRWTGVTEQTG